MGLDERLFSLSLQENDVEMADGVAPELSDVAAAIQLLLENGNRRVSDLIEEVTFLELEEFALSLEHGTYIEDKWQALLVEPFDRSRNDNLHWDELPELISLAADSPELRRLLTYITLHRFSVTRRSRPPDNGIPVIVPLGDRRYALTPYRRCEPSAMGNASLVLDALFTTSTRAG